MLSANGVAWTKADNTSSPFYKTFKTNIEKLTKELWRGLSTQHLNAVVHLRFHSPGATWLHFNRKKNINAECKILQQKKNSERKTQTKYS